MPRQRSALLLFALSALADGRLARPSRRPPTVAPDVTPPASPEPVPAAARAKATVQRLRRLRAALVARRSSLGVAALLGLLNAHVRIQAEKRASLDAFARLGSAVGAPGENGTAVYHITVVTTAALPWKTGTAVNALLRAVYLAEAGHRVTLCVPWIHPSEQELIFPAGKVFHTPNAQVVGAS